jgi:hypothetical protein
VKTDVGQVDLVLRLSDGISEKIRDSQTCRDTGSVVCLTTKGRQLERNFEELKPASHVPNLGTILNIFDVFVAVFFSPLNSLNKEAFYQLNYLSEINLD